MAKLQSLSVFVNTRLTVATVEIMGAVEKVLTLSPLKMAKLQSLSVFVNTRLTVATVEIMGAVEKVVAEYQEEISRSK
ncbi:unnamed protein product, partial [Coregonus sp. 'balchen']